METQERIIGRRKLSDIELSDADKPSYAHNALDQHRREWARGEDPPRQHALWPPRLTAGIRNLLHRIQPHAARSPRRCCRICSSAILHEGNYDRLLDFSRAVTGALFFVPSASFLDNIGEGIRTRPQPRRLRNLPNSGRARTRHFTQNRITKRERKMNNLHRELAPISDAAWEQIEEETTEDTQAVPCRTKGRGCSFIRRLRLPGVGTGHLRAITCSRGWNPSQTSVRSSLSSRCVFPLSSPVRPSTMSSADPNDSRLAARKRSRKAFAEDRAIFRRVQRS